MSLLFILLLAFSVAALAVTEDQRLQLIRKAWKADKDQVKVVERTFKCCGLTSQTPEDKCPKTVVSIILFIIILWETLVSINLTMQNVNFTNPTD